MKVPFPSLRGARLSRRPGGEPIGRRHARTESAGSVLGSPGGQRGATLVEFAIVLVVLYLLIVSIVEFGLCFFAQHTLQYATREGVRIALVGRTLTDSDGNAMTREASIIKTIRERAAIAMPASRLRISIYPVPADLSDPNGWQGTQDAGTGGAYMRVRTSYDYKFITPVLQAMVSTGKLTLQAQATYRNEQF